MEKKTRKDYGAAGLLPLLIFLVLYVGCLAVFTIKGAKDPSSYMPRQVAILVALLFALIFFEPRAKFAKKMNIYLNNAGNAGVMNLSLIVMMAGGFSSAVAISGGQSSIVNLGTSLIPSQFLVPGIFLIAAIISLCIGTSTGTIVTMAPVTFSLVAAAHLNAGMAGAAVITIIIYTLMSLNNSSASNIHAGSYNIITILPYLVVLILAVMGMDVVLVLALGTVMASAIGMALGKASLFACAKAIGNGMESMFWLAIFAMMVNGMVALMRHYGGIDWMVHVFTRHIKSKASCEALIGILSFCVTGAIVNNNISVLITSPIAKELGDQYQVDKKVLAGVISIFAVTASMVIPQDSAMMMTLQLAGKSTNYLDLIRYMVYPVVLMGLTFIVNYIDAKRSAA
ncbi:Na+/H+ antiporter NhaC family protein [Pediococcus acidilactici]|uniref:Na+/H+ antiporter NhaC family protein n=1 Tax=Pediococcus acidilactici TaxID=1254 RepID=UPI00132BEE9A|nr:Na+/H+ antiporter NhaC family protein [Pediococcus acidilactici]KAF0385326.1 Na+/H+ antiporter NhaC family protein [Pediococcus acidilactici]KAF0430477.1 Na+/H+ antiporter NhaC family protein [Pediococcus acidilactici]KAF0440986.1 Na+/H+ antiporter NhaC family protein [Pediococcus acidilactici]